MGKEWVREDGATMKVEQCLIDANWGASTDVVYQFCRESPYAHILMPSHGRYIGASSQPLNERRRQPGERVGQNWLVPSVNRKRAIRHLVYDTNFWKSFVAARWLVTLGDRGCLSLWGRDPVRHLCYAEHLCAEYRVPTEGRGRKVDEWKLRPESHDNHWLDCTVGCAVAASMLGETLPCANLSREKKPKRALKLSSVQKRKEMGL
ncbi:MAG: terminase gpA endonuclease subunit [Candidatus Spyradenecus sp.]